MLLCCCFFALNFNQTTALGTLFNKLKLLINFLFVRLMDVCIHRHRLHADGDLLGLVPEMLCSALWPRPPVILVLENHVSHSLPLIECARQNQIVIVGLPSHTTHLLQPLDVHVNGPLKENVLPSILTLIGYLCLDLTLFFYN